MKIKSLFIKDYNQFKDFELDLTYPHGHAKAGQPLDKVCIIGQSGTGKTTLLRFLQEMTDWDSTKSKFGERIKSSPVIKYGNSSSLGLISSSIKIEIIKNNIKFK